MNKFLKNTIQIFSSNILTLIGGILSTFIIPHILSKFDFGMYRTFFLYTSYTAFLHFGFVDGIFLVHSGQMYNNLIKKDFRLYSKFFIFMQLIISLSVISISLLLNIPFNARVIVFLLGIYTFLINVTTYYQYVARSVLDFEKISFITTLQAIFNMLFLFTASLLYFQIKLHIVYEYYLISNIFICTIIMIIYIYKYRDITFGPHESLFNGANRIKGYFKKGIIFTISYQLLVFMNNIDNQFISIFFNTLVYSTYSFTYSMSLLVTTFFGSISSLLLPYMKRKNKEYFINNHSYIISSMFMIIFILLISYLPLKIIIINFFPKYLYSIRYAIYVFPSLTYSCLIESFIFNSYAYFKRVKSFFLITFFNIIFSLITLFILNYFTRNPLLLSFVSTILIFIWYFLLEKFLSIKYGVSFYKNTIYSILMNISFIISMNNNNLYYGLIIYGFMYFAITFLFYKNIIAYYYKLFAKNN